MPIATVALARVMKRREDQARAILNKELALGNIKVSDAISEDEAAGWLFCSLRAYGGFPTNL